MTKDNASSSMTQLLVNLAAFIVVVAGMKAAQPILVPFLLSAFIAVICAPLVAWLNRHKVPTSLSVLLVVFGLLSCSLLIAVFIGSSLNDFSQSLPVYQARLQEELSGVLSLLAEYGVKVSSDTLLEYFDPGMAMEMVANTLSGLGGALTNAFLIVLTVVFILLEGAGLPNKLKKALHDPVASLRGFEEFAIGVNRYLVIKTVVSIITGLAIAGWLWVLDIDYPFLWGLVAFLLNYVPNIGSIIAAIPAVLLGFVQFGAAKAGLAALGYLVANIVMGNIIEPRYMGRGLGLSTLVVFLSLVFWGWVLGPVGMLLSIPLTMIVRIALESSEATRWISVLLGPESESKV
ncbi:MAG: AI-2E family transporter [Pseudomonadales bacterium]|nr:AI-2E family transporter [Pseudomonadales bacterium]